MQQMNGHIAGEGFNETEGERDADKNARGRTESQSRVDIQRLTGRERTAQDRTGAERG